MPETTYLKAIQQALREEMERDPAVLVLGEDVAVGGPFGATAGLLEQFGPERVMNTPIAEGTVVGLAVGAAAAGLRPVAEVMFIDFITLAMDQLVNQAAKYRYMSGGQMGIPLVVRTQGGAGYSTGSQHSQSLESWLLHVPGLKLAMPSTPADVLGLLKTAIRDPDPVVVVENRALYGLRGQAPEGDHLVPLGQAKIVRMGRDVTVVAFSRMVREALEAAEELAAEGVELEVIDPRCLTPLDMDTLVHSIQKTQRCVVAHEAVERGGVGAEIGASLQQAAFDWLDAPILRIGAPFAPVPFSPPLERAYLPGSEDIIRVVRGMLGR